MIRGAWLVDQNILLEDVPNDFINNMKWLPEGGEIIYKKKRWGDYVLHFQSLVEGKVLIMFDNCLNENFDTRNKETYNQWNSILGLNNWLEQKEFTKLIDKYI